MQRHGSAEQQCDHDARGRDVETSAVLRAYIYTNTMKPAANLHYILTGSAGKEIKGAVNNNGYLEQADCIPDLYILTINNIRQTWTLSDTEVQTIVIGSSPIGVSE